MSSIGCGIAGNRYGNTEAAGLLTRLIALHGFAALWTVYGRQITHNTHITNQLLDSNIFMNLICRIHSGDEFSEKHLVVSIGFHFSVVLVFIYIYVLVVSIVSAGQRSTVPLGFHHLEILLHDFCGFAGCMCCLMGC